MELTHDENCNCGLNELMGDILKVLDQHDADHGMVLSVVANLSTMLAANEQCNGGSARETLTAIQDAIAHCCEANNISGAAH